MVFSIIELVFTESSKYELACHHGLSLGGSKQSLAQEYTDADNEKQRPIMIHRAVFGSIERFFGILVENFAGAFPLWLAPVQVKILLDWSWPKVWMLGK